MAMCGAPAEAAKPTRYLSNLPFFVHSPRPYLGLPVLDANHRYLGPLPAACPHVHHPVSTEKSTSADKWNLSQVASWPERLCQFLSAAFDFSLQADGETRSSKPKAKPADLFARFSLMMRPPGPARFGPRPPKPTPNMLHQIGGP